MTGRVRTVTVAALMALSVSQAAAAQEPDAAFRADVVKLMEVTGAAALGTQVATMVADQMIVGLRQQYPDIPDRALGVVKEVLNAEFAKMFEGPDSMKDKMVALYMKHFTHQEVRALTDFYNTELGRKTVSVLPKLTQEGAAAGQEWAKANIGRILATLQQRLRDEGFIK